MPRAVCVLRGCRVETCVSAARGALRCAEQRRTGVVCGERWAGEFAWAGVVSDE